MNMPQTRVSAVTGRETERKKQWLLAQQRRRSVSRMSLRCFAALFLSGDPSPHPVRYFWASSREREGCLLAGGGRRAGVKKNDCK